METIDTPTTYGEMLPRNALFLTEHKGTASNESSTFSISHMMDGAPVITCCETGKRWRIGWQALLNMAEKDGITKPWEE